MIPTSVRRRRVSTPFLALALGLLAACGSAPEAGTGFWSAITPYKVEVVQGNVVTKEQAALIKTGMSRNDVRAILGSPLLTDVFHTDRWDYVFSIRRQGTEPQQRMVTVRFEGDRVSNFRAEDLPSEKAFVSSIATEKPSSKEPKLELSPEELKALPTPPAASAPSTAVQGAARSYPPLEPAPGR